MLKGRILKVAAAVAIASATVLMSLGSTGASAAPVPTTAAVKSIPVAATRCDGRICVHATSPSGGMLTFNAWVYRSGDQFYGHYDLVSPTGGVSHRPLNGELRWTHTLNAYWLNYSATVGTWCVIAYQQNFPGNYSKIGTACVGVG